MPASYPLSGERLAEYVDVDELGILLTKRPMWVLKKLTAAVEEGKSVRVAWKPGPDPIGYGLPCFHIEDLSKIFRLPADYVEEIVRFRRIALGDRIFISLVNGD